MTSIRTSLYKQIQDARGFGNFFFFVNHILAQTHFVKRWGGELLGAGGEEAVPSLMYSELMHKPGRT